MGFIFYDTETSGLEAPFNQILQFGAICTDPDLRETDRFEIRCRLLPHVVPSPVALQVNGITAVQLSDPDLPSHYEMIRAIRKKLMSWAPCTFVGYNSINFDEHFLRHALYQTLHPPYLTNTGGNTRADLMRIVMTASLFTAGAIDIPTDQFGQRSLKLALVAASNGFEISNAHDAMADAEAVVFLARQVAEKAPEVWSAAMRFSKRAAVVDFMESETIFSLSDFYNNKAYSWLVTLIGRNSDNNAECYVYNLAVDPEELIALDHEELLTRLQERPKPVRIVRSNAAPVLMSAADAPDIAAGRDVGIDELERRAEFLRQNPDFVARLTSGLSETREAKTASPYVEEQIYDGFTGADDERIMEEFHRVPWERRVSVLEKLSDKRLRQLGLRLVHNERPDVLDTSTRQNCDQALAMRLSEESADVPWLTLQEAITEVEELLRSGVSSRTKQLLDYHRYLLKRLDTVRTIVSV